MLRIPPASHRVGDRRVAAFVLCGLLVSSSEALATEELLSNEHWVVEPFTQALSGGPDTGPVQESGGGAERVCGNLDGYLFLIADDFIDVVTPEGMRRHLAGTGRPGYEDGPAHRAQFRLQSTSLSNLPNMTCGSRNDIFVADIGNRRVRRIFKHEQQWQVVTWAGGGKTRFLKGQSGDPKEVNLGNGFAVAALADGSLIIGGTHDYYRVNPDGTKIGRLGGWPASTAGSRDWPQLNMVMGDTDPYGNVYFVSRSPDVVVKIDPSGAATHLAGRVIGSPPKPHHIGDGPPREAYFDTPTSLVADQNRPALYVCGGDEYDVRRIPSDGVGPTATLMQNGIWGIATVHPNRSRGAAVHRPKAQGKLQPEGELTVMLISGLQGRDNEGRLYGIIYHWKGMTQYVEGENLIGTRVFRLRRVVTPQ